MDEELITKLLPIIAGGGPLAIVAVLLLAIALLLSDRARLAKDHAREVERVDKMIAAHAKQSKDMIDALADLRVTLWETRARRTGED